jgi:GMP synthase (glutamine-hydrolysing)
MELLVIEHEADAGLGVFAGPIEKRGWELTTWRPADGEPAPSPAAHDGVLALGGSMNVDEEARFGWLAEERALLRDAFEARVPTLGVCLGSQLLAAALGSRPGRASSPEIGWFDVELTPAGMADPLLSALPERFCAFQWHSYQAPLPPGAEPLAHSPICLQAYRAAPAAWGIQFHAEVSEEDALAWTANHEVDPNFARLGLDAGEMAAEIRQRIARWNELGAALSDRFCELIATRA